MSTDITIKVENRRLVLDGYGHIPSNSEGSTRVFFEFESGADWHQMTITGVFTNQERTRYATVTPGEYTEIPYEVVRDAGAIWVSLVGVAGDSVVTSLPVTLIVNRNATDISSSVRYPTIDEEGSGKDPYALYLQEVATVQTQNQELYEKLKDIEVGGAGYTQAESDARYAKKSRVVLPVHGHTTLDKYTPGSEFTLTFTGNPMPNAKERTDIRLKFTTTKETNVDFTGLALRYLSGSWHDELKLGLSSSTIETRVGALMLKDYFTTLAAGDTLTVNVNAAGIDVPAASQMSRTNSDNFEVTKVEYFSEDDSIDFTIRVLKDISAVMVESEAIWYPMLQSVWKTETYSPAPLAIASVHTDLAAFDISTGVEVPISTFLIEAELNTAGLQTEVLYDLQRMKQEYSQLKSRVVQLESQVKGYIVSNTTVKHTVKRRDVVPKLTDTMGLAWLVVITDVDGGVPIRAMSTDDEIETPVGIRGASYDSETNTHKIYLDGAFNGYIEFLKSYV